MWRARAETSVPEVIESLNQRGGRMLTAADLLAAGTLDVDLLAYLMRSMRRGASVITCAGPGGTGKTTLLGALLCFVPGDIQIKVVDGYEDYAREGVYYLCHELGRGYYSYLWGEQARLFLQAAGSAAGYGATTAHADSLSELRAMLVGPQIGLDDAAFSNLDLIIFMRRLGSRGSDRLLRRVTKVYRAAGAGAAHQLVNSWDGQTDTFVMAQDVESDDLAPYRDFLIGLYRRDIVKVAAVREAVLEFYEKVAE